MITIKRLSPDQVKITFALPDDGTPVAVIGTFNGWDPACHPLRRRSNGTRSVAVSTSPGSELRFRYVADTATGLSYFDDLDASWIEPNGFGETHGVLAV